MSTDEKTPDSDPDDSEELYPLYDAIGFSRIHQMFRELPLFDDVYLNMQAMNIAMIDTFITEQEYALLREYFEIEKTLTQQALFVSALSQMWIFALYELLRTWSQRARKLKIWKESGALSEMLKRVNNDEHNLGALMRARHIEWVINDDDAIGYLEQCKSAIQSVFDVTSAIRINLAMHEIKGKPNVVVRAPGYGRINRLCGALDYELDLGDRPFQLLNRRDIAEMLPWVEPA